MLTMLGNPRRFCNGLTRREALQAGSLGLLGGLFGAPGLSEAAVAKAGHRRAGKAKSVIVLFLHGGAATQDMFDMKPDAPIDVRGEFKSIATSAPGIQICEHLPRLARWMHRAALVRSVNHRAGCHNTLPTFTGYAEPITDISNENPNHPPSMGSVCEYLRAGRGEMPAYVCLPHPLGWGDVSRRPGTASGFLGQRHDPLIAECTPFVDAGVDKRSRARPPEVRGEPRLPHSVLQEGLTLDRLNTRQGLMQQLDQELRRADAQPALNDFGRHQQRAFGLLNSQKLRAAFDLEKEDPKCRDRYGHSLFGQSVLTARKLVEAGVRFVNVFWDSYGQRLGLLDFGWDTHEVNFLTLRDCYLPWLDRTASALLADLQEHGLLDETLVVILSDFGRTPRVNKDAGRDHWSYCYTVLLAGAGIRGGSIYGASDAQAAFVKDNPVRPADVCATIYECLGIDPALEVYERTGRPVPAAQGGRALREIVS